MMKGTQAMAWCPQNRPLGPAIFFLFGVALTLTVYTVTLYTLTTFDLARFVCNSQGIANTAPDKQSSVLGRTVTLGQLNSTQVDLRGAFRDESTPFVKKKLILMYNGYYQADNPLVPYSFDFRHCKVKACEKTFDKALLDIADAVVLQDRCCDAESYPARTSPHGVWVWLSVEPCVDWRGPDRAGWMPFNWTMTYARYSEVGIPYGGYITRPAQLRKPNTHWERRHSRIFQRKQKMVVWMVNHCGTSSQREVYVEELKKYIDVDIYGGCDGLDSIKRLGWEESTQMIKQDYKFYLSFENSFCQDYITEKFWKNAILNEVVPVVRGGYSHEDYVRAAPPNSFIDTRNFTSPKVLAKYLKEVASSEELYKSYFKWEYDYMLLFDDEEKWDVGREQEQTGLCNLCEALHSDIPFKPIDPYVIHNFGTKCHDVPHPDLIWNDTNSTDA